MESKANKEERDVHYPSEEQPLSDTVLEAIERYRGTDLTEDNFALYDDVDPDALDDLFREDADANTTVQFNTDSVTVTLQGDGGVEIQVTPRDDEE